MRVRTSLVAAAGLSLAVMTIVASATPVMAKGPTIPPAPAGYVYVINACQGWIDVHPEVDWLTQKSMDDPDGQCNGMAGPESKGPRFALYKKLKGPWCRTFNQQFRVNAVSRPGLPAPSDPHIYTLQFSQQVCWDDQGQVWFGTGPDHRTQEHSQIMDVKPPQCNGGLGNDTPVNQKRTDLVQSFCAYELNPTITVTVGFEFGDDHLGGNGSVTVGAAGKNLIHRFVGKPGGCIYISGVHHPEGFCPAY